VIAKVGLYKKNRNIFSSCDQKVIGEGEALADTRMQADYSMPAKCRLETTSKVDQRVISDQCMHKRSCICDSHTDMYWYRSKWQHTATLSHVGWSHLRSALLFYVQRILTSNGPAIQYSLPIKLHQQNKSLDVSKICLKYR